VLFNKQTERRRNGRATSSAHRTFADAMMVSTSLDHQPASILEVPIEPLLPNIVTNAARSEIRRLAYMSPVTVTISLGGLSWTGGTVEAFFGMPD